MRKYWGFYVLNLKVLWDEKVTFIWTIIFPSIFALSGRFSFSGDHSHDNLIWYLAWFWVYIIVVTFVNGLGLQLASLKEYSHLKTYTLLAGGKHPIIIPIIFVQLTICAVSLLIFTSIMLVIYQIFSIKILLLPLLGLLFTFIPVSLLCMLLPTIPIRSSGLGNITNVVFILGFIVAANFQSQINPESIIAMANPFQLLHNFFMLIYNPTINLNVSSLLVILLYFALYIFIGVISYRRVNLVSTVQR